MDPKIDFVAEIDTHKEIDSLLRPFQNKRKLDIDYLKSQTDPTLYEFQIEDKNKKSSVIRTQQQISKFCKLYNKKAHQLNYYIIQKEQSIKDPFVLSKVSEFKQIRQQKWYQQFFSFDHTIPNKKISVNLKKLSGGRYSQFQCCLLSRWKKCKAFLLQDGIVTYNQYKNKIQQYLNFDKDFKWEVYDQIEQLQVDLHSYHRKLSLKCQNSNQFFIFIYKLFKLLAEYKKTHVYRFNSFGPIREKNQVKFFVDGESYFESVAEAIQNAQNQIFICGWWISPQFALVRPCNKKNQKYRLDNLLGSVAKNGVKIYVIVYFQSSFLTNDSSHTIKALQDKHPNIKVLRHPQIKLPTYWSHHQKLVVVDRCIAFLGGLDICYGRYDTPKHEIDNANDQTYPGIEYNNCRIADFVNVKQYKMQNIPRHLPRLPWHDVALMAKGDCVQDLTTHFIQYWNYASFQTHYTDRYVLVSKKNKILRKKSGVFDNIRQFASGLKNKIISPNEQQRQQTHKQQKTEKSKETAIQQAQLLNKRSNRSLTPVKKIYSLPDYIQRKISPNKLQNQMMYPHPKQTQVQIRKQFVSNQALFINLDCQSRSHDEININCQIKNQGTEAQQIEFEKQQLSRIQRTQKQVQRGLNELAKIQQQIQQSEKVQQKAQEDFLHEIKYGMSEMQQPKRHSLQFLTRATQNIKKRLFNERPLSLNPKEQPEIKLFDQEIKNVYSCQVLRSASQWSIGCKQGSHQKSIHDAYISLISRAQKYIYIENQFFISATRSGGVVKNQIMNCLCQRIIRAIRQKEQFKVIVMMPLVPGFAGQLDDPDASLPRVIMNWQYRTICKGQNSLLQKIKSETGVDPSQYIQFYSLRNHGMIANRPVTQIIYLHSKLMIVDDRQLICGSANINDRSMEGDRDSELCLLVSSRNFKKSTMNGQQFYIIPKIQKLRVKLWEEHFGIFQQQLIDATSQKLWNKIRNNAEKNTQIYRNLFGCYPDDKIQKLEEIKNFRKLDVTIQQYEEEKKKIRGHVVVFPLNFLRKQNLTSFHPNALST